MNTFRTEIASQARLAAPIVLAQLGQMLMGLVDTLMVGRIGGEERAAELALSAVTMGHVLFYAGGSFAFGTLSALDPLVSQAIGASDREGVSLAVQRSVLLALLLSALVAVPLFFVEPILRALGQPPESIGLAVGYVHATLPSVPFFFLFAVQRLVLQSMHSMRPVLIVVFLANLGNVFFNWVLIFGHLGLPAYGVVGSGWATTLSRVVLFAGLLALAWPTLRPALRPWNPRTLRVAPILRMLRLGVPVGFQSSLEFCAFGLVAIVMGTLGSLEQAAHAIAINVASLSFMVPLGISAAAAVRVGRNVGRGDSDAVRRSAAVSMVLGVGAMACSALLFVTIPMSITSLYTGDAAVFGLAAVLLPLAGAFQLFDGAQVVALGCLRGVGDTFVPMLINLFGYWGVGLPVGYWLTYRMEIGATGPWWGLVAGLAAVAIVLALRTRAALSGDVRRIDLEQAS
ncbi:MAG: MATE family efflux transporter [Planctomycetota bacterium]